MTDRYHALLVTLDKEIRDDDLENWINAIRMMRRVVSVEPACKDDFKFHSAKDQIRSEWRRKLFEVLQDD